MTEIQNSKPVYNLEERTIQFAKDVRLFVKILPKTISNFEDGKIGKSKELKFNGFLAIVNLLIVIWILASLVIGY